MGKINPREKLSPEDYLYLYWFEKISNGMEIEYSDFQPSESMINRFNAYIQYWNKQFKEDLAHYEKPVDWDVNRPKTVYYKEKLQAGHEFEVWVEQAFQKKGIELGNFLNEEGQYSGENEYGLEIKHDMRLAETGNIYIEYQERLRNTMTWVNSGILKDDNAQYWIIGNQNEHYFFKKETLVDVYNQMLNNHINVRGCRFVSELENETSKGFIMSRQKAKEVCFATTIDEFFKKLSKKYYACGYYFHGNRRCKYIASKKDNDLQVFDDIEKAQCAGYRPCTDENCID